MSRSEGTGIVRLAVESRLLILNVGGQEGSNLS
jgi:hypothetical protein